MNEKLLLETSVHEVFTTEVVNLLRSRNISSVLDFTRADSSLLVNITGLSLREVLDVKKTVLRKYAAKPVNAMQYYRKILDTSAIISTGVRGLDSLLQGGLLTGNVYEICGLPSSGKTYLCLSILRNVAENTNNNIHFIDTKGNFSGIKMKQMLAHLSKERLVEVLSKIQIKSAFTAEQLFSSLCDIITDMDAGLRTRIVIIDSLAPICLLYDAEKVSERNRMLTHVVNIMRYIANEYQTAILVTNLMTLWNEGDFKSTDEFQEKLACGKFWHSIPTIRLKIEKSNDNIRAKITLTKFIKSLPNVTECGVTFTDFGFE